MLGLNSESGSGLGLELGCIQYIKLLIQYIKLLIQYTINWVAFLTGPSIMEYYVEYCGGARINVPGGG